MEEWNSLTEDRTSCNALLWLEWQVYVESGTGRILVGAEGSAQRSSRSPGAASGLQWQVQVCSVPTKTRQLICVGTCLADADHLGRWRPCVRAEGGKGEPWLEAVGGRGQAAPGKSRSQPGSLPLCSHRLPVHLAGQFDRENGSALLPWAPASRVWSFSQKAIPNWLRGLGKEFMWLFLRMATIKMKVWNAELESWDPWRNAADLLKTSRGGMWGTELRSPKSRWDQASSQWCEPGKRGVGVQVEWIGGQLGLLTACRPHALASCHKVCPPDPKIF